MSKISTNYRPLADPVGCWWGAYDNGEVWPVEILSANLFGVRVRATHEAAPQGEIVMSPARVYDSRFNRVMWGSA